MKVFEHIVRECLVDVTSGKQSDLLNYLPPCWLAESLIEMLMILPIKLERKEHETCEGANSPIDLAHKSVF